MERRGNRWHCKCKCGRRSSFTTKAILAGPKCRHQAPIKNARLRDLLNQRFSMLVVEKRVIVKKTGRGMWLCRCECGRTRLASSANLVNKHSRSCGQCVRWRGDTAIPKEVGAVSKAAEAALAVETTPKAPDLFAWKAKHVDPQQLKEAIDLVIAWGFCVVRLPEAHGQG